MLSGFNSRSVERWQFLVVTALLAVGGFASISAQATDSVQFTESAPPQSDERPARRISAGTIQFKLMVKDLERSATFYKDVLQVRQAMRFSASMNRRAMEEILLEHPNGSLISLVIIKFLDGISPTHEQAVFVFFTDDIDAFIERVKRNGGKVTERRDDPENKARIAFWYDPEGNLAETVQLQ